MVFTLGRKHSLARKSPRSRPSLEILEDRWVPSTFSVSNTSDSGAGSLRQAILDSNSTPGQNTISFANMATGLQTIQLLSLLPTITNSVSIDGTTKSGFTGTPLVELDGELITVPNSSCLTIATANCTVKDLIINRFSMGSAIVIDGSSAQNNLVQGNYLGTDSNGTAARANLNGITFADAASKNTIGGTTSAMRNIISGNSKDGIVINAGSTNNTIQGNYIGTNVNGNGALANSLDGIDILAANTNTVGGTLVGSRNVISGNKDFGVFISGGASNTVLGNYIGLDASGSADVGNGSDGVHLVGGASSNKIGGTTVAARNVISGNNQSGIYISDSSTTSNTVTGNYIGLNAAGTSAIANNLDGIEIANAANLNTVGGTVVGARNVISGNNQNGVQLTLAATSNSVTGNYIGLNATGTAAVANQMQGVRIDMGANNNTIGGRLATNANRISGNLRNGILITDSGTTSNIIERNFIGLNARGQALGNTLDGILIASGAQNSQIGEATSGPTLGVGNTIEFNARAGVAVTDVGTIGNDIRGNSISGNSMLGIDLGQDGVTLNHSGGAIPGPNNFQNFPVLTSATQVTGGTQVQGTLNSDANATFTIDFYSNTSADPSGYGQGLRFKGSTTVTTDANGNASFTVTLTGITTGQSISATATDSGGNTSEFAQDITASAAVATTAAANANLTAALVATPHAPADSPSQAPTAPKQGSIVSSASVVSAKTVGDGYIFAHHVSSVTDELDAAL